MNVPQQERLTEMAQIAQQLRVFAVCPYLPRWVRYKSAVMAEHVLELSAALAKLFEQAVKR